MLVKTVLPIIGALVVAYVLFVGVRAVVRSFNKNQQPPQE